MDMPPALVALIYLDREGSTLDRRSTRAAARARRVIVAAMTDESRDRAREARAAWRWKGLAHSGGSQERYDAVHVAASS